MSKVKNKERILKAAREKQLVTYRAVPIRLSADSSEKKLQPKGREQHNIFKKLKGKGLQPSILYPASLSLRIEGEIKKFPVYHH